MTVTDLIVSKIYDVSGDTFKLKHAVECKYLSEALETLMYSSYPSDMC